MDAGHRGRIEFIVKLRRSVAGLRKRLRDENLAVHAAWFGPTRAEQAKAARIKEAAAATARVNEAAAASIREAAKDALKKAAAAAVRIKEAAKNALVKATAKTVPVKTGKKPAKKVRGH
jgi:hypothetical protein